MSSCKVFAVAALLFLNAGFAFSADKLIALTFDVLDDRHYEENVGITCSEAAEQLVRRGHELEKPHLQPYRTERSGNEESS